MMDPEDTKVTQNVWKYDDGSTVVATLTVETYAPCPYTYSHTKHVCGHPGCRES